MSCISSHYNNRQNVSIADRKQSPILQLKSFNNWIKSVLIQKYCPSNNACVFDMACGKGGDLNKWLKNKIKYYYGADIAATSIKHAKDRYASSNFTFKAEFHAIDCFSVEMEFKEIEFDLVSVQFALHYSFESENKARIALLNATKKLKKGGYFIGTIPNAYRIVKNMKKKKKEFGNRVYKIRYETVETSRFGHEYTFDLEDAIDSCPEYVINKRVLVELASGFGLQLVYYEGFHEMYLKEKEGFRDLIQRMRVLDQDGSIDQDQWEAIGLYDAFSFKMV